MNSLLEQLFSLYEKHSIPILGILVFFLSFLISYRIIPWIILTVRYKKLMDNPNSRSSHIQVTPTLGGIAFFASIIISLFFINKYDYANISINIIAALVVIFFMGLKDDLMVLSAKGKITLQSIAIFFIIVNSEFYITNIHGFLNIGEVPLWISYVFSFGFLLYFTNAFNLIDGIDGLASMLGILISSVYAYFFIRTELYFYAFLGIIVVGFLIAFLRYNLSSKNKIFMGDTGSLIVGFLLGILSLRFLSLNLSQLQVIRILPQNLIIVVFSLLFFPVLDVIRVSSMRFFNKAKIFSPDKRHMHHIFVDKGLNHFKASLTLVIASLITFISVYLSNSFLSGIGLCIVLGILVLFTFYVFVLLDKDNKTVLYRKKIKKYIPDGLYKKEFKIRKAIIIFLKKIFYKELL